MLVSSYQPPTDSSVATAHSLATRWGSSMGTSRSRSRRASACSNPMAAPRPSDGLVQAHESPTGSTPVTTGSPSTTSERRRSAILAMTATASSRGSASIQWAQPGQCPDRPHPAVRVAQRPQRAVGGTGHQDDRPGPVVGGQGERAEAPVGLGQPGDHRRQLAVVGAEVAAEVDEARVVTFLGRGAASGRRHPPRQRRTPAGGVDDEVGLELAPVLEGHAGHVRHARAGRRTRPQGAHGSAPPDGDRVVRIGHRCQCRLGHRTAGREGDQLVVPVPRAPGDGVGDDADHVEAPGPGRPERRRPPPAARPRRSPGSEVGGSGEVGTGSRRGVPTAPRRRRGPAGDGSRSSTVSRWPSAASSKAADSPDQTRPAHHDVGHPVSPSARPTGTYQRLVPTVRPPCPIPARHRPPSVAAFGA